MKAHGVSERGDLHLYFNDDFSVCGTTVFSGGVYDKTRSTGVYADRLSPPTEHPLPPFLPRLAASIPAEAERVYS